MPRSGCSALHGVNPNLEKKKGYTSKRVRSFVFLEREYWATAVEKITVDAIKVWIKVLMENVSLVIQTTANKNTVSFAPQ